MPTEQSQHLAPAVITAALRARLEEAVEPLGAAVVITPRVDGVEPSAREARVELCLHEVSVNTNLRNTDLPTRAANGQLRRTAQVALDLLYLITFVGDTEALLPERLLGRCVAALIHDPILSARSIEQGVADTPCLAGTDADEAVVDQRPLIALNLVVGNGAGLQGMYAARYPQEAYRLSIGVVASPALVYAGKPG
jgi:hypothetical protein